MSKRHFIFFRLNFGKFLGIIFVFLFIHLILLFPEESVNGGVSGLNLCANIVIPSLFPFAVIAQFLLKSGFLDFMGKFLSPASKFLFNLSGKHTAVFLISLFSGYPVGAGLISNMLKNNEIDRTNAKRMLLFSVNAGPAFIIIAVGQGILHSKPLGVILFASHILTSLILVFLSRFAFKNTYTPKSKNTVQKDGVISSFVDSVASSSNSMLSICSFVVLFSVIIALLRASSLSIGATNFLTKMLEVTVGVALSAEKNKILFISFLLGWSGVSVHFQVLSAAKNININIFLFLLSRILHGAISVLFTLCLLRLFPTYIQTISNNIPATFAPNTASVASSVCLIFTAIVFLFYLKEPFLSKKLLSKRTP